MSGAPDSSPALRPAASAPVDIRRIEPELTRIVEGQQGRKRLHALLDFLRRLTNARAVLLVAETGPGELAMREELWTGAAAPPETAEEVLAALRSQTDPQEVPLARVGPLKSLPGAFLLVTPVTRAEGPRLFACLILFARRPEEIDPFLIVLQTMTGYFHAALDREGGAGEWALLQAAALVEVGTAAAEADDFLGAAAILTEHLRRHLACFWACLGLARGGEVRLSAISGVGRFDAHGPSTLALQAAMGEALAGTGPMEYPAPEGQAQAGTGVEQAAHRELVRLLEVERVISLPLFRSDGRPLAVLTFLWDARHPFRPQNRELLEASAPYLQAQVSVLRRADPAGPRRWLLQGWRALGPRQRLIVRIAIGAAVLLLFCPFPQHIRVPCRVEPLSKRVVSSPYDGILQEARDEPGQFVKEGDVLAVMDDKELRFKEAELQAARDRALTQRDKSLADPNADYAASRINELEAQEHQLDLDVVEYQIGHLEIRSPVDGVLLAGDLKRAAGVTVTKGQVLFEVAPLDALVAEMEIPDTDIAGVREGMEVSVRLEAVSGTTWTSRVTKVHPQSEIREGENVFTAQAELPPGEDNGLLRPGMKGKAVIVGDRRPLIWLLTHRIWETVRLALFW